MALDYYHRERNEAVFRKNRSELAVDPDEQADGIKGRFKKISRRLDRASRLRSARAALRRWANGIWIAVGVLGGSYLAIATTSPWPVSVTVRHLLAAINCDVARAVGLGSAVRGTPGYWPSRDADGDGIACEPWPRTMRR
jgi:hypothetical protein